MNIPIGGGGGCGREKRCGPNTKFYVRDVTGDSSDEPCPDFLSTTFSASTWEISHTYPRVLNRVSIKKRMFDFDLEERNEAEKTVFHSWEIYLGKKLGEKRERIIREISNGKKVGEND